MAPSFQANSYWVQGIVLSVLALLMTVIIFVVDKNVPSDIAISTLYCLVILYSWLLPGKNISLYTAFVCSILVLLAISMVKLPEENSEFAGLNRVLSLITIWVCTVLVTVAKRGLKRLEKVNEHLEEQVDIRTTALDFQVKQLRDQKSMLAKGNQKFRNLLDSTPDGIVIVNKDSKMIMVNKQMEEIYGYSFNDMMDENIDLLIPERYRKEHQKLRNEFFQNPKKLSTGNSLEVLSIKKDGTEFPVEIKFNPLQDGDNYVAITSIRDITKRKIAEAQVRNAKELEIKNKELEQFVYVASHDLQEPLNTISNMAEMIEESFDNKELSEDIHTYTAYLTDASNRMSTLINELLDYSRIGSKKSIELLDTNEILNEVLKDLSSTIMEKNAQIESEKMPKIKGNKSEIRSLFQNIISNALKFQENGTIPKVKISAKPKNQDENLFVIEDNGIGIDKKQLDNIFIIFKRLNKPSKYKGTGIGLAHCKKIVESIGGKIWVKSKLGTGSVFYFTIPKSFDQ